MVGFCTSRSRGNPGDKKFITKIVKSKPYARFNFDRYWREQLFPAGICNELRHHLDLPDEVCGAAELMALPEAELAKIEVLVAGWGAIPLTREVLERMPRLRAVFYAAGDTRGLVADGECFHRGITVMSANPELARSVAEHTLGLILVSLRNVWRQATAVKTERRFLRKPGPGTYRSAVGLVGYGAIARELRALLRPFAIDVLVYDPYLTCEAAEAAVVKRVELIEIFETSDVVSCHLPMNGETRGMLGREHFLAMRQEATFINTARGGVVREEQMLAVLAERSDLWAILDVLVQDPPEQGHPVFDLPNVVITPHIAGCLGKELARIGCFIAEEVGRWRDERPLRAQVVRAISH